MATTLLNAVDADTVGTAYTMPKDDVLGPMGVGFKGFFIWGDDFGSGTVTVEVSHDGTNWFTLREFGSGSQISTTVSDHYAAVVRAPYIRGRLNGATNPSNVSVVMWPG